MSKENAPEVFISHIHEERGIALVLQKFIRKGFGSDFAVFVASDPFSIGGGRKWFEHILESLKQARVVLVLVSDESKGRPWINFEAGCGEGRGALIIPVGIRGLSLGKLAFPLLGYNGRSADDIEGLLYDISTHCGRVAESVDRIEYLRELREAEECVTYRSVILRPYIVRKGKQMEIRFEVRNQGNVDAELLHVDISLPVALCDAHWTPLSEGPRAVYREVTDGRPCYRIRLTALSNDLSRLEPVLTRSMGWVQLPMLSCPLHGEFAEGELRGVPVFFQVYARNYDTTRDSSMVCQIPEGPSIASETTNS